MRIDAHQHFWTYDSEQYAWITPALGEIRRDFGPADLAPLLDAAALDGSIAVQARSCEAETRELLALAHASWASGPEHPSGRPDVHPVVRPIFGVVGWLDLAADDFEAALDRYAADPLLVGLRHIVQDEPDDRFLDRADFRRGVRALARRGLVYDVLVYPRQLPAAIDFAAALEDAPLVLDHCAKPPLRAGSGSPEWAAWERGLRALARCPNVTCKVSGLVTEADWQAWRPEDILRAIDVALAAFGPERVIFGSDWPVALLAAPYAAVYELTERAFAGHSAAERAAFFGGNARRVYGAERGRLVPSSAP